MAQPNGVGGVHEAVWSIEDDDDDDAAADGDDDGAELPPPPTSSVAGGTKSSTVTAVSDSSLGVPGDGDDDDGEDVLDGSDDTQLRLGTSISGSVVDRDDDDDDDDDTTDSHDDHQALLSTTTTTASASSTTPTSSSSTPLNGTTLPATSVVAELDHPFSDTEREHEHQHVLQRFEGSGASIGAAMSLSDEPADDHERHQMVQSFDSSSGGGADGDSNLASSLELGTPIARPRAVVIRTVITSCVSLFLWACAFSIQALTVQAFMKQFFKDESEVSFRYGLLDGTLSMFNFFCSPLTGLLSDRFGRKPLLLMCLSGVTFYGSMAVVASFIHERWISMPLLYLGASVAGATSGERILYNAILSDLTSPKDRPRAFGLLGLSLGLGFIGGAAIGFVMSSLKLSYQVTFGFTASLFFVNLVLITILLPESLDNSLRSASVNWSKGNPVGSFLFYARPDHGLHLVNQGEDDNVTFGDKFSHMNDEAAVATGTTSGANSLRGAPVNSSVRTEPSRYLMRLVVVLFCVLFVFAALSSCFQYYANVQHGWIEKDVYLFLFVVGMLVACVQGVGSLIFKRFRADRVMLLAIVCRIIADPIFAFSNRTWQVYVAAVFLALSSLQAVAIQGIMSTLVGPRSQGQLFGANGCVDTAAVACGKYLFNFLFGISISKDVGLNFPGAIWILSLIVCIFNFFWAGWAGYKYGYLLDVAKKLIPGELPTTVALVASSVPQFEQQHAAMDDGDTMIELETLDKGEKRD